MATYDVRALWASWLSRGIVPEPGMGATVLMYTDRHAATIVRVSRDRRTVWVARDTATRTDTNGMSESQTYAYTPGDWTQTACYTLRKNGRWVEKGVPMRGTPRLLLGHRRTYFDYSF